MRLPRSLYNSALSYFARLRVTGEQLQVQWRHSDARPIWLPRLMQLRVRVMCSFEKLRGRLDAPLLSLRLREAMVCSASSLVDILVRVLESSPVTIGNYV